jgi:Domain of unknown function (DUF1707)/Cell wall-active antibiotics response 4TMS YvqF
MSDQRASDAERDATVDRLRAAAGEGRLTVEELAERSELGLAATTRGELDRITADLPAPAAPPAEPETHRTVLSSAEHGGRWRLAATNRVVTILGSTRLDLRHAVLPGAEVEIEVHTVLGSVDVTLPEGAVVEVIGGGFVLDRKMRLAGPPPAPGAPLIRIRTSGAFGSLKVSDRPPFGVQVKERLGIR